MTPTTTAGAPQTPPQRRVPRLRPRTIAILAVIALVALGVVVAAAFFLLGPRKAAMDFASALAEKDVEAFESSLSTKATSELAVSQRLLEPDVLDAAEPLFSSARIIDVEREDRSSALVTLAVDEHGSPATLKIAVAVDDEAEGLLPQWKVDERGWRQLAITVPPGDSTLVVNGVDIHVDELRAPGHGALPLERAATNDESDRVGVEPRVFPAVYDVAIVADGEHAIARPARRAAEPLIGSASEWVTIGTQRDGVELSADLTEAGRELIAAQLREQIEACLADPSTEPAIGSCPEIDEDAADGATLLTEDFSPAVSAQAGWWNLERIGYWYAPDGADDPMDATIDSVGALVVLDDAGRPQVVLVG